MDLRLLRYFVAVAEERNVTRAAQRLRVAQPSLSHQLLVLERQLGAPLLDRSTRPLQLTPAGERLLDDARRLLRQAADSARAVAAIGAGTAGTLEVGVIASGLHDLLLPALRGLRAELPAASVRVRTLAPPDQLAALRRGEVDLVVHRRTDPAENRAGLVEQWLRDEQLVAVLPQDHPAGRSGRVLLADLAAEEFHLCPRWLQPAVFDGYLAACRAAGFEPRLGPEGDDPQTRDLLVAAGAGVGLTGDGTSLRLAGARYLPVDPPWTLTAISAVWRHHPPALVGPLVAQLSRHAAGTGRDDGRPPVAYSDVP